MSLYFSIWVGIKCHYYIYIYIYIYILLNTINDISFMVIFYFLKCQYSVWVNNYHLNPKSTWPHV
ncbi:MAG: hypothetical protein N7Q72_00335, partial [Spiroplasma sp. Tabriz.8]|nr:hypothetical protein [Spiroplasma sp. Tabriz.8]